MALKWRKCDCQVLKRKQRDCISLASLQGSKHSCKGNDFTEPAALPGAEIVKIRTTEKPDLDSWRNEIKTDLRRA